MADTGAPSLTLSAPPPDATPMGELPIAPNGSTSFERSTTDLSGLKAKLRAVALMVMPAIYKRGTGEADFLHEMGIRVPDWGGVKRSKGLTPRHGSGRPVRSSRQADGGMSLTRPPSLPPQQSLNPMPKLSRAIKSKANGAGRQYTSKFRGVHQTFPTKRWEAQFRRNGKPTSLGCFDHEEQAARAYDKMMLWCELHNTAGVKGGITNYDPSEYDKDVPWLRTVTQDELIEALRSDGRRQAAHRMLRQKREGVPNGGGRSSRAKTSREGTSELTYSEEMGGTGRRGSSMGGDSVEGSQEPEMESGMQGSQMMME